MRSIFEDEVAEAALMVDDSNAFNSLNREVALRNTHILGPSLAPVLTNTYHPTPGSSLEVDTSSLRMEPHRETL